VSPWYIIDYYDLLVQFGFTDPTIIGAVYGLSRLLGAAQYFRKERKIVVHEAHPSEVGQD
jgi:hypothetical protein